MRHSVAKLKWKVNSFVNPVVVVNTVTFGLSLLRSNQVKASSLKTKSSVV
ncbi:Uncharacterised protein [Mycobacterium tuberculosis]|nr:Uncharacterised protein [Mycobacterium tuberculosis]